VPKHVVVPYVENTLYSTNKYTGGAKKCIHILRDVIYVLLFEVELSYGSNV